MDPIALKPGRLDRQSETRFLYQPEDYTGALVLHCHFLGHEDRGMMTNVQVTCPTSGGVAASPISFGTRRADGGADDCAVAPADSAPLLACPGAEPAAHGGGGHGH
jgi:hypothetical protein